MKRKFTLPLQTGFAIVLLLLFSFQLTAQDIDNPGGYMTAISSAERVMSKTYLDYISAVAHSGKARKVEKKRQQTLESIQNCKYKISDLPYYKGDNSLRKSSMEYIDMCYKVFNEDYAHIVNMEEIADQSIDGMQFYILTMEKTNEKLHDAFAKVEQAQKDFAAKYNVTIVDTKDRLSDNMEITSKVNHYKDQLYLIFFKCNWQDEQITKAINAKKITGIEESRNALAAYAKEGLLALDSLDNFDGDHSLAQSCRQALMFYQKHAEVDLPRVTDFFLKEEAFNKLKKSMDIKGQDNLTKQDVDAYNKAVKDYNATINEYNQLNNNVNTSKSQMINNWNNANMQFMDAHIPRV